MNRLDVPIQSWKINNESQLRYVFQHILYESFYYSPAEIREEKSVFSEAKFEGRIDTFIQLADFPAISWVIEYKNSTLPSSIRAQIDKYISNLDPKPIGYSILWKEKASFYIAHFKFDHDPLELSFRSFFPMRNELISLWQRDHNEQNKGQVAQVDDSLSLLNLCGTEDWEKLGYFLEGQYFGRLHHSQHNNIRPFIDRIEKLKRERKIPDQVLFYFYKMQGDLFDCWNALQISNDYYMKCAMIAKKLNNKKLISLSKFLLGINKWRMGAVEESQSLHQDALQTIKTPVTPNILSEQILVELGITSRNRNVISRVGMVDNQNELYNLLSDTVDNKLSKISKLIVEVSANDSAEEMAALEIVALYYQLQGRLNDAFNIHKKVLKFAQQKGLQILEGWVRNDLGLWFYCKGCQRPFENA